MASTVTIADCERVQANWFRFRAEHLGGQIIEDGPLTWTAGPDGVSLLFPIELPADALSRGIELARAAGVSSIGVWINPDVDAAPLAAAGFERGWSPWWMSASAEFAPEPLGRRAGLIRWESEDPGIHALLELIHVRPKVVWAAEAFDDHRGELAGHAWAFLDGEIAGVFDMDIYPRFRRRGLATELLETVCSAAARGGAAHLILNATPDGKPLYEAYGFELIGEGATWWLHL